MQYVGTLHNLLYGWFFIASTATCTQVVLHIDFSHESSRAQHDFIHKLLDHLYLTMIRVTIGPFSVQTTNIFCFIFPVAILLSYILQLQFINLFY